MGTGTIQTSYEQHERPGVTGVTSPDEPEAPIRQSDSMFIKSHQRRTLAVNAVFALRDYTAG